MNKYGLLTSIFGLFIFFVTLSGGGQPVSAELADRIVAIVNDDCITLSELNEALGPYLQTVRGELSPNEAREMRFELREKVLNKMINQKLAAQEARRLKIWVEEKEVDEYLERTKEQNSLTDEDLRKALAAEGLTFEHYRQQIKEQILQMKIIELEVKSRIAITGEDIRNYYENHKKDYQAEEQYRLRTMVIKIPDGVDDQEKKAARKRMDAVVAALKAGGAGSFHELAGRFSEEGAGLQGGDLGLFSLDELSEKIRDMVRGMNPGEITPVFETPQGYQILMVQEVIEGKGKTLDEVKGDIQEKIHRALVAEKYEAWVKGLRERSFVRIMQ